MKPSNHSEEFEAYLGGLLAAAEISHFKHRLQTDPGYKKEYIQFLLSHASWSNESLDHDREMMKEVYQSLQEVPYEKPTTAYLVKHFIIDHRKAISVAASIVLLIAVGTFLFWNPSPSNEQKFVGLFMEPVSMERASVVEKQFFEKASFFYFQEPPMMDSLEAQAKLKAGFTIPVYYLAHAYFKKGQYEKALKHFELCLGNLDYINQVPQLQGSDLDLRFNTLLCKVLLKRDKAVIELEISSIEKSLEPTHPLHSNLKQLRKELN